MTIDNPSSRLIRWHLRLAEYDFEVKYKKGKVNTQAGALSRLNTAAETIVHDNSDDIPVFSLDLFQMNYETNNDMYFTELQYSEQEAILEAHETKTDTQLDPIELDEVIHKQLRS